MASSSSASVDSRHATMCRCGTLGKLRTKEKEAPPLGSPPRRRRASSPAGGAPLDSAGKKGLTPPRQLRITAAAWTPSNAATAPVHAQRTKLYSATAGLKLPLRSPSSEEEMSSAGAPARRKQKGASAMQPRIKAASALIKPTTTHAGAFHRERPNSAKKR